MRVGDGREEEVVGVARVDDEGGGVRGGRRWRRRRCGASGLAFVGTDEVEDVGGPLRHGDEARQQ